LHILHRAGGHAALAAERAENIIATLTSSHAMPEQVNKLTTRGERRIDGCKKYDLGGGYRLVYVKEADHYVFLCVATHDDCDRWLTNNKDRQYLQLDMAEGRAWRISDHTHDTGLASSPRDTAPEMDYDDMLMQKIDDKMLRRIFHGLCCASVACDASG
jgi:hypothetical protein